MNIFLKYCKKCKKAYDVGINFDFCAECRTKENVQKESQTKLK